MDAVWEGIIRRSNAKKDIEKALGESGDSGAVNKATVNADTTVNGASGAYSTKPTVSAAPADVARPKEKKPFKLTPKMIRRLVIGAVAIILIAAFAVIWHNHELYLATPAGQANAIYNDNKSDKATLKKKYGDKYDEYYGDLRRAADRSINGGVNAVGVIEEDKKELKKWDADDVGKAQFCMIYSKKTATSDDEITEVALVYYLATVETEMGVKVYGVKGLPLTSDKYPSDTLNSLVKNLTKDDAGSDETE